jgi:hypothetical protein
VAVMFQWQNGFEGMERSPRERLLYPDFLTPLVGAK